MRCPEGHQAPRCGHYLWSSVPWLGVGWWVLTWVSVKLSRACITDCSGLEAWDYKERDGRVTSEWLRAVSGGRGGKRVLGAGGGGERALNKGKMVHLWSEVARGLD